MSQNADQSVMSQDAATTDQGGMGVAEERSESATPSIKRGIDQVDGHVEDRTTLGKAAKIRRTVPVTPSTPVCPPAGSVMESVALRAAGEDVGKLRVDDPPRFVIPATLLHMACCGDAKEDGFTMQRYSDGIVYTFAAPGMNVCFHIPRMSSLELEAEMYSSAGVMIAADSSDFGIRQRVQISIANGRVVSIGGSMAFAWKPDNEIDAKLAAQFVAMHGMTGPSFVEARLRRDLGVGCAGKKNCTLGIPRVRVPAFPPATPSAQIPAPTSAQQAQDQA